MTTVLVALGSAVLAVAVTLAVVRPGRARTFLGRTATRVGVLAFVLGVLLGLVLAALPTLRDPDWSAVVGAPQFWGSIGAAGIAVAGVWWTAWATDARADRDRAAAVERETRAWERQEVVRLEGLRRDAYAEMIEAGQNVVDLFRDARSNRDEMSKDERYELASRMREAAVRAHVAAIRLSLVSDVPKVLSEALAVFVPADGKEWREDEQIAAMLRLREIARFELGRPEWGATPDGSPGTPSAPPSSTAPEPGPATPPVGSTPDPSGSDDPRR